MPSHDSVEQIAAYMRLAEQRIGSTFVADGLPCHLVGGWQGPHTLLFALRLYEPRQGHLNKAFKLAAAIEAAVGASPVRVYHEQGVICVEIPSPWPTAVVGRALRGEWLAVPLGLNPRQDVVGLDFGVHPHVLAVGPTRRGKTTAMRTLAYHLARQNKQGQVFLFAVTFKSADWEAFSKLAVCWGVISDPQEAITALNWLHRIMLVRAKTQIRTPEIFAFIDDLANLLGVAPEVASILSQLASMGGGVGVHLVIGTQRLGERGAGDALVSANIPDKIVFGTASAADAALYTGRGQTGAEKLGAYPGDALLVTAGGVQRLAIGYVSDADLATLRQNPAEARPWRRRTVPAPTPVLVQALNPAIGVKGGVLVTPVSVSAPLDGQLLQRAPTAEDAQALRALYARLDGNKNRLFRELRVVKNPRRAAWLAEALREVAP